MHTGVVENEQQKTKTLSVSLPWNRLFLLHSAPKPRALGVRETEKEKEKKRDQAKSVILSFFHSAQMHVLIEAAAAYAY